MKGLNDAIEGEDILTLLDMNCHTKAGPASIRAREAVKLLSAADGEDDDSKNSKQVRDALKNSAVFKALVTIVTECRTLNKEPIEIFRIMAAHACPVGGAWLAGKQVLHNAFQQIVVVRSPDVADKVTDAILAVDVDGNPQTWQIATPGQNAVIKLLKGTKVDLFTTFGHPVIKKQRGVLVASELQHVNDANMWTNDKAMRFAEQPLASIKALMGNAGTHADGYRAYYRGMHRRCEKVDGLPEWVEEKRNLADALNAIGVQAEHEHLAGVREVSTQPYEFAQRSATYIVAGKKCAEMVANFDKVLATVLARSELAAEFGQRRDDNNDGFGTSSSTTTSFLSYAVAPSPSERPAATERHVGSKFKQLALNGAANDRDKPIVNLVDEYGVYLSPYGLVYGNNFLVGKTASATWDPEKEAGKIRGRKTCASVWAPNASAQNRARYCSKSCKQATYERVVDDDDVTVVNIQRDNDSWEKLADPSQWVHVIGANRLDEYAAAFNKLAARRSSESSGASKGRGYQGREESQGRGYQGREENRRGGRGRGKGASKGGKPTAKGRNANAKGGGRANGSAIDRLHFEAAVPAPSTPTLKPAIKAVASYPPPKHAAWAERQTEELLQSLLGASGASAAKRLKQAPM